MRLWTLRYGKEKKAIDFAGRTMDKAAYDDRNSEFGWNLDHVFPQSKGGKTTDYNLVCCHILTNDEKADKICFHANGHPFKVVKVQNHYEIRKENASSDSSEKPEEKATDTLYDSAYGIRLYKKFKGLQNKTRFVGTVEILLEALAEGAAGTALTDFIEETFLEEDIHFMCSEKEGNIRILVNNYKMPNNEDVNSLLDKCVLLNTYLGHYFEIIGIIKGYRIQFRLDYYADRNAFYAQDSGAKFTEKSENNTGLMINSLVIQNSYAKEKYDVTIGWDMNQFYHYDYYFKQLGENLEKEASRQN